MAVTHHRRAQILNALTEMFERLTATCSRIWVSDTD